MKAIIATLISLAIALLTGCVTTTVSQSAVPTTISHDQVRDIVVDSPLKQGKAGLVELIRPGYRLFLQPSGEELPLGTSHLSGLPDLPNDVDWPAFSDGEPLLFIGQINLAELPDTEWSPLPKTGLLSFFIGRDIIYPPDNTDWVQVIYSPETAGLKRRPAPPMIGDLRFEIRSIDSQRATFTVQYSLPGYQSPYLSHAGFDAQQRDHYYAFIDKAWNKLFFDGEETAADHRVLGYAFELQYPMEMVCSLRRTFGTEEQMLAAVEREGEDAIRDRVFMDVPNWVLLLQLDSDHMRFGDNGLLYIWIHKDDLAAQRFDRAIPVIQNH